MITVEHLTKRYRSRVVVDDVSFTCPPGTVTGFLGPNGAGKSTTMKMIAGLVSPSYGRSTINGVPYRDLLPQPATQVGFMLDGSATHPGRTGHETLLLAARTLSLDNARVSLVIDQVGLSDAARRRVGTYSLGMKQRLMIGLALLGGPRTLILDEPYNGLDPAGIQWIRSLMRQFANAGGTVLVSSHLLNEVRESVDRVVVINGGRISAEGEIATISGPDVCRVETPSIDPLLAALTAEKIPWTHDAEGILITAPAQRIGSLAHTHQIELWGLAPAYGDALERFYFTHVPSKESAS